MIETQHSTFDDTLQVDSLIFNGSEYFKQADLIKLIPGQTTREIAAIGQMAFYATARYGRNILTVCTWKDLLGLPKLDDKNLKVGISVQPIEADLIPLGLYERIYRTASNPLHKLLFNKNVKQSLIEAESTARSV
jgi:hypothetical protein